MIKKILLAAVVISCFMNTNTVSAAGSGTSSKSAGCEALQQFDPNNNCNSPSSTKAVDNIFQSVLKILSLIVGLLAIVMIIVAGFKYVTANGDSNATASAKNTLLYALAGLLVAAFAQVIARFVLSRL